MFTSWSWDVGQYEVLHLFSKKAHDTRVLSRSSLDTLDSAPFRGAQPPINSNPKHQYYYERSRSIPIF